MVVPVIHVIVCDVRVCENQEIAEPRISAERTTSTFREKCTAVSSTDTNTARVA